MATDTTNPCLSYDFSRIGDPHVRDAMQSIVRHMNLVMRPYVDERTKLAATHFPSADQNEFIANFLQQFGDQINTNVNVLPVAEGPWLDVDENGVVRHRGMADVAWRCEAKDSNPLTAVHLDSWGHVIDVSSVGADVVGVLPAIAQGNYDVSDLAHPYVSVKLCEDWVGTSPTGSAFNVYLPFVDGANYPNVHTGDVIGIVKRQTVIVPNTYEYAAVALHLDAPLNTIRILPTAYAIPAGWTEWTDGQGNFLVGLAPAGTFSGAFGGSETHTHVGHSNHADHPARNDHTHDVTESQSLTTSTLEVDESVGSGYTVIQTVSINTPTNTSTGAGARAALSHDAHSAHDSPSHNPPWRSVYFIQRTAT